ncbi:hypothetical protein KY290_011290 [Solanum tuberosum]|uniref:FAS1 domain-containing protein n=1 Tax=Solanum tuberosum TaxID=4113 RepID=A0ABQ7W082_SOLTU|nr:hypothetical protein KY290_011290 [Solanum tuberosum]
MTLSLEKSSISLLLLLFLAITTISSAHNITLILAKHPEFSTFNRYLTLTHLASEINRRQTITVCAVNNAAMGDLLDKHMSIYTLKNVLSLHVFADYFGSKQLHRITKGTTLTATLFQATGEAPGTSGYVNITNMKGKKVGFTTEDNDGHFSSNFVKSIQEIPYNISVIQLSNIITSPAAEAPVAAPADVDLIDLMSKKDEEPLAVYKIDKVLQPSELFKSQSINSDNSAMGPSSGADDGDGDSNDNGDTTNNNGGMIMNVDGGWFVTFVLSIGLVFG